MKSIRKNLLLTLLFCLCVSLSCFYCLLVTNTVKADSPLSDDFKMTGASIMLVPNGEDGAIRFSVQCSENDYALVSGGATSGILILPSQFLGEEDLVLNKTYNEKTPRNKIIDEFWIKDGDVYTAYVYMYGIPTSDYNTYLTARAYFTVEEETYYSNTVDRSIAYVASKALVAGNKDCEDCCTAIVDSVVGSSFAFEKSFYEVDSWENFKVDVINNQGLDAVITTDNDNVVVDGEYLKAVNEGTTTLTAKIGSKETTATVTINKSEFEEFTPSDLSKSKVIATGKTASSYAYKSTIVYGGHTENLGLSIKANEYIQIAKPINFISAGNMFTKMWFGEMSADEYKGATLNLLFTSINTTSKRFVIRLEIGQDGYVYTSVLGGLDFDNQFAVKNVSSVVGNTTGYINLRTNVNGVNTTCQIDNSYAFTISDIADYGDMYLTIFSDKDVDIAFDYYGDALYSGYMTGYDALELKSVMVEKAYLNSLQPTIATEIASLNLYAMGSTTKSFVYDNADHSGIYAHCLGINLKENEWLTINEDYTNISNGWTSFIFNDMTADEYKGVKLTMLYVSKADNTKRAALEFNVEDSGTIYLTKVYGGEISSAINCGTAGSETTFDVVSNVGSATAFNIRNRGAFTMPDLGDCIISFTTNKDIKFSLSYFNDARRWNTAEANNIGKDALLSLSEKSLKETQALDITTFNGDIAKGTNDNTFVYSTDDANYIGIQIGAEQAITFAQTVSYKAANATYMTRSYYNEMTMPEGTELEYVYISKADNTKRFSYTIHFSSSGNYVTLAGTDKTSTDHFTGIGASVLFQVNSALGTQLDIVAFSATDDIVEMGEMILVIKSNKEVRFTFDYLNDARPWQSGYNALTDYDSHTK